MDTQSYNWEKVVVEPLWLPLRCPKTGLLLMVASQTAPSPQVEMVTVA